MLQRKNRLPIAKGTVDWGEIEKWGEVERKFKKNSRFILGTKNKIFLFH